MKPGRRFLTFSLVLTALTVSAAASRILADCGPFTDVTFFCAPILELYDLGIAGGTSPTTYAPAQTATRGEIAAFLARSFNQTVKRSTRRAALGQWWAPKSPDAFGLTSLGSPPQVVASDGADVWVAAEDSGASRVRASDGRLLDQWTGDVIGGGIHRCDGARLRRGGGVAKLYSLDPRQPAGSLTEVATGLGVSPGRLAFDGSRIWTANEGNSVSIVTPGASPPWSATTVDVGHGLAGILYDGANVWATSFGDGVLIELDSNGAVLQTAEVGEGPAFPVFDGANIWVPNETSDSVSIVRASTGAVIRTLTGNGLNVPSNAAFDGERVLVTNLGGTVSLSRAADLAALGSFSTGRRSPSGFAGTA